MKLRLLLVGVVLGLFATNATAQVPATWVGTWKLNLDKSKYSGVPTPKSQVDKTEVVDGALKYTSDRVSADGKAGRHEYTARVDGKDYPYVGLPGESTISLTKVDDLAFEWVIKKGGKVFISGRTAYSPDGKSRTMTFAGTNPKGEKVEATSVFDKQ